MNTRSFSVVRENGPPLVEVGSFSLPINLPLKKSINREVGYKQVMDTFWRFPGDSRARTAAAVSKLLFGVIATSPEVRWMDLGTHSGSYLTEEAAALREGPSGGLFLIKPHGIPDPAPEILQYLVQDTNELLISLNSPYRLPLE